VLDGAHREIALPRLTVGRIVVDPADAAAPDAVARLAGTDHVAALTGALDADLTAAASQQAERLGVPMVSGSASAASLTGNGERWFWRVGPSDRTYVEDAFAWLHTVRHPIARLVVVNSDDQADRDGAAMIAQLAPPDVQVTEDILIPGDGSDVTPEVQRLAGYAPDVLLMVTTTADAVRLVQTMAHVGYTPAAVVGLGEGLLDPGFASGLGALADDMVARAAWSPEIARHNPVAAAVMSAFRQEFGQDMTADSARDFEAVLTIGAAVQAADSTEPARLRAALARTDTRATIMPWSGIRFDSTGQNALAGSVIEQLTAGQYHVVYPAALATTSVVWPMLPLDKRS
jgi:branched-chain amino acid transport system substrate-binding protein